MELLLGRYAISLDSQGRLALPASWRHLLYKSEAEPSVYLLKDLQYPAVRIYLADEYNKLVAKCVGLPEYSRDERIFRMLICGGLNVPLRGDRLMLVINEALRSRAGCQPGDKVGVNGEGNYATVWRSDLLDIMLSGEPVPGATEKPPLKKEILEAHGLWSSAPPRPVAAAPPQPVAAAPPQPVAAAAPQPVREEAVG